MRRLKFSLVIFAAISALLASCYYDSEEALYPDLNTNCDTILVTFSSDIVPMLANNCLSCHSNAAAAISGNNIRLEDYADVKTNATTVQDAIKHIGPNSPMPKNGGKLSSCLISQFDIWVRDGMVNN